LKTESRGEEMVKGFSRSFKVTLGIIGVIVAFILLVMLVGAIGDASSRGKLAEIRDSSLAFLKSHIREDEGNAVDYFLEAAALAADADADASPYLNGLSEISPSLTKDILENLDAIARITQGAKMEFYSYPYDYQKGAAAELPDYFNLSKAIKLTCAKALFDLEKGRSDNSLDALFDCLRAGKLIASGTPVLFDVAIGNSFAMRSLEVLHLGLASGCYDQGQLERIDAVLTEFEEEWPLVGLSLEGEVCGMAIIFFDALKHPAALLEVGEMLGNSFGDVFRLFVFRLVCWRFLFSPSRMYLGAHEDMNAIVDTFKEIEGMPMNRENREDWDRKRAAFREDIEQRVEGNLLLNLTFPNVFAIYNRRLETITAIRAARLCCAIRAFQRDNRRFPVNLQELGGDIIYDFNTGKVWQYQNNGDSATIASPGSIPDGTKDDIAITLTNLGIAGYLKQLRATEGKK
jgi:hypothetical protein